MLKGLRRLSKSEVEKDGVLCGVVDGPVLYVLGITYLGEGSRTQVAFDSKYKPFHNEFMQAAKQTIPSLTTVLYHNHPKLRPDEFPEEVVRQVMQMMEFGLYDHLPEKGRELTLENALVEFTQALSEADIASTFGRAHVIVTDSATSVDELGHINAFKFNARGQPLRMRDPIVHIVNYKRFSVRALKELPTEMRCYAGGVCSSLGRVYDRVKAEIERQNTIQHYFTREGLIAAGITPQDS